MGDPEADLKLTIFLSCLIITVLGSPPFSVEASGVIADVRVWHGGGSRCSIGGLISPRWKKMEVVIQDKPIKKLEDDSLS